MFCVINGKVWKYIYLIIVFKNVGINDIRNIIEFDSEEIIKERELSGVIVMVLKKGDLWKCLNCLYLMNFWVNCVCYIFIYFIFKKFGCLVCLFRVKCSWSIKNYLRNCYLWERIRFKIYIEVNNFFKKFFES